MKRRGVISIGTNSTRALVADLDENASITLSRSLGTRIGEGLDDGGVLQVGPMLRTLEAVRDHTAAVRALTDDFCVIATSALRRAANAEAFAGQVRRIAGVPLGIISGDEEARRSFAGAVSGAPPAESYGVLDCGGGSTEYAAGTRSGCACSISCETGAVRLTLAFPELAGRNAPVSQSALQAARGAAFERCEAMASFDRVACLLFVGGSATTAVSLRRGNRDRFLYERITQSEVRSIAEQLVRLPFEARKAMPGMNPQRADILLAGLLILDVAFARLNHHVALASTNDVLLGTLLKERISG